MSQSTTSDAFLSEVLGPLKSSFLYEESEQSFKYTSTLLIKNAQQERKVSLTGFPHFQGIFIIYKSTLRVTMFLFQFPTFKITFFAFLCQYNAFREKKRELGYTDEDLKESFGFLLFSNINEVRISRILFVMALSFKLTIECH